MLENIVEDDIIERENVVELDLTQSLLGGRHVAEGVRYKHSAVIPFDTVQKTGYRSLNGQLEPGAFWRVVRGPASDLQYYYNYYYKRLFMQHRMY